MLIKANCRVMVWEIAVQLGTAHYAMHEMMIISGY